MLRGEYSNSSNSTARITACQRSAEYTRHTSCRACGQQYLSFRSSNAQYLPDHRAPGPARGNDRAFGAKGRAVPMEMAAETGFRKVMSGLIRLLFTSTCSIASGMPWPLMAAEPYAGHETHNDGADHRNHYYPDAQLVMQRRRFMHGESSVK